MIKKYCDVCGKETDELYTNCLFLEESQDKVDVELCNDCRKTLETARAEARIKADTEFYKKNIKEKDYERN